MTIWLIIMTAAVGTYLMRASGNFMPAIQAKWLDYAPYGIIVAMSINSITAITHNYHELLAATAASITIVVVSLLRWPLMLRIILGCVVFGMLS